MATGFADVTAEPLARARKSVRRVMEKREAKCVKHRLSDSVSKLIFFQAIAMFATVLSSVPGKEELEAAVNEALHVAVASLRCRYSYNRINASIPAPRASVVNSPCQAVAHKHLQLTNTALVCCPKDHLPRRCCPQATR